MALGPTDVAGPTMTKVPRLAFSALAAFVLPVPLIAGQVVERQVVIVVQRADDARITQTREAIGFWNTTLAELGVAVRLRESALVVSSPSGRAIETFARFVSQRGGRIPKGASGPQPPAALSELTGDIVVLLSRQPLLPFAWPLTGSPEYFVAIRTPEPGRPNDATVLRNIIAHELGHTLGLTHHRTSITLMCGPCSSVAAADSTLEWLPLTDVDRERLRALHPAP